VFSERAGTALSCALVLLALSGCGGSAQHGPAALPRDFFRINSQLVREAAQAGKLDYADHQVAQMAKLGVGFVRASFDWQLVEPTPPSGGHHTYDFSTTDTWVAILARHGLRWLVTAQGGPLPPWDAKKSAVPYCGSNAPPAGTAAYADLMRALAERYGRDGLFWRQHPELPYEPITEYEVWNEPNFAHFWCPRPDPQAYARLYLAAHAAVHAVDAKAIVLVGGLAAFRTDDPGPPAQMSFQTFLSRMVDSTPRIRTAVDAVGVHPYGPDPTAVLGTLQAFRTVLDSNGLGAKPMLADEVGWHTHGGVGLPSVPEQQRATYFRIVTPAIARSNCNVTGIAAHSWVTPEQRENYSEDWYGIANPITGAPYPSATAYSDEIESLERGDAPAVPQICSPG
jgi:hypothetical protein